MKQLLVITALFGVLAAAAFAGTGTVFAQTETPTTPPGGGLGIMHDELVAVYAEALGLSVDEINTRIEAGETMSQIAYSAGLSADEFRTLMTDARTKAIDLAVKNGTITQEQADWMKDRGAGRMMGVGNGRGRGGRAGGAGTGPYANPDCPYLNK